MLLGPLFGFPQAVQAAARHDGPMRALAALREQRGSAAAIRRWARAHRLGGALNAASKPELLRQVGSAVAEQRLLLAFVPELPRPVHVQLTLAAAPRIPVFPVKADATPQQQADARVAGMDAVDRVLTALQRSGKHMGPTLGNAFAALFTADTAKMLAVFLIAGAAANTNPVTAAVFDTAMIGFAWYVAGTTGIEALGTLFSATVAASGAGSEADLEAAGKGFAEGFIGLGGAVFMAWLAKRMSRPKARGSAESAGEAPVEQAPQRRQRVREEPAVVRPAGVQYEGQIYRLEDPARVSTTFDAHQYNVAANHRYSGPGKGGVYGGTSPGTALAEVEHYGVAEGRVSVSKPVKLDNVLDLTSESTRQQLGVSLRDLTGDSYKVTQRLGDWARTNGYDGILAPSARDAAGSNLVIFPKGP